MLTKTITIMRRQPNSGNVYYSWQEDGDRDHVLELDEDVMDDLGRPETITVTIDSGDQLNEAI